MNAMETFLSRYPELARISDNIDQAIDILVKSFTSGGKLLLCGNGGSAADCEHISGELLKGFRSLRPLSNEARMEFANLSSAEDPNEITAHLQYGLPAIPLTSLSSAATAFANDVSADLAFAQLVYALGKRGDVLMAISTSGNARNVVRAAQTAQGIGMHVIGLTGAPGGDVASHCTCLIPAPGEETYEIQEYHLPVYHYVCVQVEKKLFGGIA